MSRSSGNIKILSVEQRDSPLFEKLKDCPLCVNAEEWSPLYLWCDIILHMDV